MIRFADDFAGMLRCEASHGLDAGYCRLRVGVNCQVCIWLDLVECHHNCVKLCFGG